MFNWFRKNKFEFNLFGYDFKIEEVNNKAICYEKDSNVAVFCNCRYYDDVSRDIKAILYSQGKKRIDEMVHNRIEIKKIGEKSVHVLDLNDVLSGCKG